MPARTVVALLYEGVRGLDVAGPLEVFAEAGKVCGRGGYRLLTASGGGRPVRASNGLTLVSDCDLWAAPSPHTLVVPGGAAGAADAEVLSWLWQTAPSVRRIMSVCTGAFVLAQAGLLAGRRATTHWASCDALAERFPDVDVDPEPLFVRDGNVATSGGVASGIDLALALVEDDHGRETALAVARRLTTYLRRPGSQAQFSGHPVAGLARRRPVRDVQRWITEHPAGNLSVDALARRANLSTRQFARTFLAEVGMPPGRYVERVRLEAARRMLEESAVGVEEVARACGFGVPETMRRVFLRTLGMPPAEYRRRF